MSSELVVYTFGGGDALTATFNMVKSVIGTDDYTTAIKISLGFALMWVLLESAFKGVYKPTVQWAMTFMLLFNILLVPKVDIKIVDRLDHGVANSVITKVPWGLGWFASMSSRVGDVITRKMEMASSLPNDMQYHKTGVLFGSHLIEKASRFRIVDSEYAKDMESFIKQCVFYDIYYGKYTLDELVKARDIWQFINQKGQSPIRAFSLKGEFKTCREGAANLASAWDTQIDKTANFYGKQLFRKLDSDDAKVELLAKLPGSYRYILGVSQQAGNIMRQNMMVNAFQSAIKNSSSELGADAAITNYVHTRAESQATAAYKSAGKQAEKFVPLLRVVFESLYYGAFPLILLAMMLPIGAMIAKNYFMAFVWIQSWGPLYAILNLLMTLEARTDSLAMSTIGQGEHAITLMTQSGVHDVNISIGVLAGYLSMSIPFIAAGITKGVGSFTHLATSMLHIAQSAGTHAAEEGTTGNIRLGASSQGVHSYNTTSANQWQTSSMVDGGSQRYVAPDGSLQKTTADGRSILDAGGAHSNMPTAGLEIGRSVQSAMTNEAGRLESMAQDQQMQSRQSEYSVFAKSGLFDMGQTHSITSADGYKSTEQAGLAKEASALKGHTETFSADNQVDTRDGAQLMAAASASIPFQSLLKIAGVGLSSEFRGMTEAGQREVYSKAQNYAEQNNIRDLASSGVNHMLDRSFNETDNQSAAVRDSMRADWSQAQDLSRTSGISHSQAEQLRSSLASTETNGVSFRGNMSQEFWEWIQEQPANVGGMHQGRMGMDGARTMLNSTSSGDQEMLQGYVSDFVQHKVANISGSGKQEPSLANRYEQNASDFSHNGRPENLYSEGQAQIASVSASHHLNQPIDSDYKNEASAGLKSIRSQVELDEKAYTESGNELKNDVKQGHTSIADRAAQKIAEGFYSSDTQDKGETAKKRPGVDTLSAL